LSMVILILKLYLCIIIYMKKIYVKLCSLILSTFFIASLFCFSGCSNPGLPGAPGGGGGGNGKTSSMSLSAFNTGVYIETVDGDISTDMQNSIRNIFIDMENKTSATKEGSFIHTFNNAEGGVPVSFDNYGEDVSVEGLYTLAQEYYLDTEGKFNPAVYPLMELWGFMPTFNDVNFTPPSDTEVQNTLAYCNFSDITYDINGLTKPNANYKLDFGGFIKGFTAEMVGNSLYYSGFTKGYVNVGSSSFYIMSVDSLGVRHPNDRNGKIITISGTNLSGRNVSTSGTYERVHAGTNYHHIIDTRTGKPADTGFKSVTVVCSNGGFADAVTTALCTCAHNPYDDSLSEFITYARLYLRNDPTMEFYAVYEKDGIKQIVTNKMVNQDFTINDAEYQIMKF